jgi:hypothetical protein
MPVVFVVVDDRRRRELTNWISISAWQL